jgi:hypothetical protein
MAMYAARPPPAAAIPPSVAALHSADRAIAVSIAPADRQWEAARAELDRTHSRIASLTAGLDLPARAPAWQLEPPRREAVPGPAPPPAPAVAPARPSESAAAAVLPGGDAAFWRRESERAAADAERLRSELELCRAARDAATHRADEAAAAAESAARACDAMKDLAGEQLPLAPAPAAAVWWARRMENLQVRVALARLRDAWRAWSAEARRSYLYRVQNGSLYGGFSRARSAAVPPVATPLGTPARPVLVSVLRSDGELERRPRNTLLSSPTSNHGSNRPADRQSEREREQESPRWEATRPDGDDWRPFGASSAESVSPVSVEQEQLRSVPEVGSPLPPSVASPQDFATATQHLSSQRSSIAAASSSASSSRRRRSVPNLGAAFQPATTAAAGAWELPGTQRWALLHLGTHTKDAALARTAAEQSDMLGAVHSRAEQHLVDVRRRLRTASG